MSGQSHLAESGGPRSVAAVREPSAFVAPGDSLGLGRDGFGPSREMLGFSARSTPNVIALAHMKKLLVLAIAAIAFIAVNA